MKALRLRLPPLTCLLVFEAAARHCHFTKAAKELGVTQSAVSRQISHLEDHLGRALFSRSSKGIALTEAGEILAARLRSSFDGIADTILDIRKMENERPVILSASTAFCHFWIVPHLSDLTGALSQVRLRIEPHDPPLKLDEAIFDVGVFYGNGGWSGTTATKLLSESVFPVASPELVAANPRDTRLEHLPLLQYECFSDTTWINWETWFAAQGTRFDASKVQMSFRNYSDLINAALAGQGLALGWFQLLRRHLNEGSLVRVGPRVYSPPEHYYLVVPANRPLGRAASMIAEWLSDVASALPESQQLLNASSFPKM